MSNLQNNAACEERGGVVGFPGGSAFFVRPFACRGSDLGIDFGRDEPSLITELLGSCLMDRGGRSPTPETLWDLTLGKRIEALLAILFITRGGDLECRHPCRQCGEDMEVVLANEALAELQRESDAAEFIEISIGNCEIVLRKPTGRDQRGWMTESWPDEHAAVLGMIGTLVSGNEAWTPESGQVETIAEKMAGADPLVHFRITASCPECSAENNWEADLTAMALQGLLRARLILIRTVHRLAGYYHWTEESILDMPASRRAEYLALVEKELDR